MAKKILKKPPMAAVDSSSYEIEIDGEKYYPHSEETVTFKSRGSVDTMMTYMTLVNFSQENESADAKANTARLMKELQADGLFYNLLDYLARNIKSWTWTDQNGDPYENPPSIATLKSLEFTEIFWLMSAQTGDKKPAEDDEAKKE